MTSQEMPGISIMLHTNMSLLRQSKSMNSLSYLGSRLASTDMVFGRVFGIDLHDLGVLGRFESTDVGGMARPSGTEGTQRPSSLNLAAVTVAAASSMLSYSRYRVRC
jgi:hypothetical protein